MKVFNECQSDDISKGSLPGVAESHLLEKEYSNLISSPFPNCKNRIDCGPQKREKWHTTLEVRDVPRAQPGRGACGQGRDEDAAVSAGV